jgi:uncharacterized protein
VNILDKVNKILNNEFFKECLNKNINLEKHREFCKHDLQHFLDVARICYIMVLEKKLDITKEIVNATALLHDIGKWKQYSESVAHERASAEISGRILKECGYDDENIKIILSAILNHREDKNENINFDSLFYKSDKISRNCFYCNAEELCNWSKSKKNFNIRY